MSSMKSLMEFSMVNNIPSPMKSMELLIASQNQQMQAFQAQMAVQAQALLKLRSRPRPRPKDKIWLIFQDQRIYKQMHKDLTTTTTTTTTTAATTTAKHE